MKCPVCKTEYLHGNKSCDVCGFSDLERSFVNVADAEYWTNTVVRRYRTKWLSSLKDFVFDRTFTTLLKYKGIDSTVTIPYGVRFIKDAFYKNLCINTVIIPNTVEVIGNNAFYGCRALKSINLPTSLRKIEADAFSSCSSLNLVIPESVTEIEEAAFVHTYSVDVVNSNPRYKMQDGMLIDTAQGVLLTISFRKLQMDIVVPNNVQRIAKSAFLSYSIPRVGSVVLPTGLEVLAESSCVADKDKTISIPSSVIKIEDSAFASKYNEIHLESGNANYIKRRNTLIERESRKLLTVCDKSCTNVQITPAVRIIAPRAFSFCENLERIDLTRNIEEIGYCAFMDCKKLKYIVIPKCVQKLGYNAFYGCESLTAIYCEHSSQPAGWHAEWLKMPQAKVYWKNEWEYVPQPATNRQLTLWESEE